jgi:ATP-dependent RNA helicase DeaD
MQSRIERFDQFGFPPSLMQRLGESGHEVPTHIQVVCIPPLLTGRDIVAHTDSGTGKTLAFVLPMLAALDLAYRHPQVLVLTPTDETSLHVAEIFQEYARYFSEFHVLPIYHQNATIQMRGLKRGTHVVVGAPPRIKSYIETNALNLNTIKTVVIDEADVMLQRDFMDDIEWLLEQTPFSRQTAIFSSTLPKALRQFARNNLRKPLNLRGTEKSATAPAIKQRFWQVESQSKLNALTRLIEVEPNFDAALVFVHSKAGAIDLAEKLSARGYAAAALDVDTPSPLRIAVSEQFGAGNIDIVVCTDQGADGLDVARVTHAVSFDVPCDAASHVHRIARLGDAKHPGTAILLVTQREMAMLRSIERATRQSIDALVLPERFR